MSFHVNLGEGKYWVFGPRWVDLAFRCQTEEACEATAAAYSSRKAAGRHVVRRGSKYLNTKSSGPK